MTETVQTNARESSGEHGGYIDLHVNGLAYVGRVREVLVRKGPGFLAASLRAMFGEKGTQDGVQYTPFDVRAVSEQARSVLAQLMNDANDPNKRVMVQFKLGDPYIDTFRYTRGDKAGDTGTVVKARLLLLRRAWVKTVIEGAEPTPWKLVYELPPRELPAVDAQEPELLATGTEG